MVIADYYSRFDGHQDRYGALHHVRSDDPAGDVDASRRHGSGQGPRTARGLSGDGRLLATNRVQGYPAKFTLTDRVNGLQEDVNGPLGIDDINSDVALEGNRSYDRVRSLRESRWHDALPWRDLAATIAIRTTI